MAADPMSAILVSPAEPAVMKRALELVIATGEAGVSMLSSATTEKMGLDFAWVDARDEFCGVQRKELKDFIASATVDDRLSREIGQMRGLVEVPVIIIEGKVKWTADDALLWNGWGQTITRRQWHGMMYSLALQGVHVWTTENMAGTARMIYDYHAWSQKARHNSLMTRPGPRSAWGSLDHRDYAIHLVQGLPGVGYEIAARIVDKFAAEGRGMIPFKWDDVVDESWLTGIDGVGKVKADKILRAINGA
jgi:ERCC4-type nuclease